MLYNPDGKIEYKNTKASLKAYRVQNHAKLYLYYSWTGIPV